MQKSENVIPLNDLSRRFAKDSLILDRVKNLLISGPYFKSEYTQGFESAFATYIGVDFCTTVSSGTSALELSIKALNLKHGSSILMVANAGGYAAIAAKNCGLRPYFVEVNEYGLIDPNSLPSQCVDVTAIVVTHLYGQVCDMPSLLAYAKLHNLKVIEDCAQAAGSSLGNQNAGSFGDISSFSFYPTKNLGGVGDSGAVCTSDSELSARTLKLREYGWSERYFALESGGGNYRMDEIQALVLLDQMNQLDQNNRIRQSIWQRYAKICIEHDVRILGNFGIGFSPHLAVIRVPNRKNFIKFMADHGVSSTAHYPYTDYQQPGIGLRKDFKLPLTEILCDEVVSVPIFPEMLESEIAQVEASLDSYFRGFCGNT
jgi:dTDP-4-amino-4,6-dideoxygalactose transaminase